MMPELDKIHCGDALEFLRTLPDNCVDAVVTDPPYGLGFRGNKWDDAIPTGWIVEARRVATVVAFTTGQTTLWDYPKPDWVLCWYREASNARSKISGFSHWSPILVYGKPKFRVDALKLHAIQHAYRKGFPHPSPKPVRLMVWLVTQCAQDGATVLDPFLGSGTTAVACIRTGRHFLGCEISPEYCAIAEKRIRDARNELALFKDVEDAPADQQEMFEHAADSSLGSLRLCGEPFSKGEANA